MAKRKKAKSASGNRVNLALRALGDDRLTHGDWVKKFAALVEKEEAKAPRKDALDGPRTKLLADELVKREGKEYFKTEEEDE